MRKAGKNTSQAAVTRMRHKSYVSYTGLRNISNATVVENERSKIFNIANIIQKF